MRWPGYLAIVGGTFLLIAGAAGSFLPQFLYDFLGPRLDPGAIRDSILLALRIMIFLAMLGGLSVMVGGYAITKGWKRTGKFLIFLGCALGLLGLIINIMIAVVMNTWDSFKMSMLSITGIGSIMSIAAYMLA